MRVPALGKQLMLLNLADRKDVSTSPNESIPAVVYFEEYCEEISV